MFIKTPSLCYVREREGGGEEGEREGGREREREKEREGGGREGGRERLSLNSLHVLNIIVINTPTISVS